MAEDARHQGVTPPTGCPKPQEASLSGSSVGPKPLQPTPAHLFWSAAITRNSRLNMLPSAIFRYGRSSFRRRGSSIWHRSFRRGTITGKGCLIGGRGSRTGPPTGIYYWNAFSRCSRCWNSRSSCCRGARSCSCPRIGSGSRRGARRGGGGRWGVSSSWGPPRQVGSNVHVLGQLHHRRLHQDVRIPKRLQPPLHVLPLVALHCAELFGGEAREVVGQGRHGGQHSKGRQERRHAEGRQRHTGTGRSCCRISAGLQ